MPKKSAKKGCYKQTTKKYTSPKRKSPSYPANECCGKTKVGNDGNKWKSLKNSKNICQWKAVKKASASSKPKPVKKCPNGKVRSPKGRCVKEKKPTTNKPQPKPKPKPTITRKESSRNMNCFRQTAKKYTSSKRKSPAFKANLCCGETMTGNDGNEWESIANVKGICTWKPIGSKPKPNKPVVKKSTVVQARVVAEFKPNYIRYDEYEWADDQLKSISIFKKNQHKFNIIKPIKDWNNGDLIIFNPYSPGVIGGYIDGNKIVGSGGEDYFMVPEEITKYTDDMYAMYKNLIDESISGDTIYVSNQDVILKHFLKEPLLKKINKLTKERPIFSVNIDKLGDDSNIFLEIHHPPVLKGYSKTYRLSRVVGNAKLDKNGVLSKGKIRFLENLSATEKENEAMLVKLIEKSIGKKL